MGVNEPRTAIAHGNAPTGRHVFAMLVQTESVSEIGGVPAIVLTGSLDSPITCYAIEAAQHGHALLLAARVPRGARAGCLDGVLLINRPIVPQARLWLREPLHFAAGMLIDLHIAAEK